MIYDNLYTNIYSKTYKDLNLINLNSIILLLNELIVENKIINLLEIGFGDGNLLISILKKFSNLNIVGIDSSTEFYRKLHKKKKKYVQKIKLINENFLDFEIDKMFNVIISVNVFHHFSEEERLKAFKKIFGLLEENAYFIYGDITRLEDDEYNNILSNIVKNRIINNKSLSKKQMEFRLNHLNSDQPVNDYLINKTLTDIGYKNAEIVIRYFNQTIWLVKK